MACIVVENVCKSYRLASTQTHNTFRDLIWQSFGSMTKLWASKTGKGQYHNEMYALKDVSFTVEPGEVVGIIGKNGSGKSTLLKILSRVTSPTRGRVTMRGKVASLLEVGTGFHPELSGRENIFLNGAILGMSHQEINRRFDEIVEFSGVAKFLNTPVKHYSSGMILRLAFSVAAFLDPEILIIDEVLAVGDVAFQKKCMQTVNDLGKHGKTIIFVSHDMGAVRKLCSKAILLSHGQIVTQGSVNEVVNNYLIQGKTQRSMMQWGSTPLYSEMVINSTPDLIALHKLSVCDQYAKNKEVFSIHEPIIIDIEYSVTQPGYKLSVALLLYDEHGQFLFFTPDTLGTCWQAEPRLVGRYHSFCTIPGNFLNSGTISISVSVIEEGVRSRLNDHHVAAFTIHDDMQPTGARGDFLQEWPAAAVRPVLNWRTDFAPAVQNATEIPLRDRDHHKDENNLSGTI